MILFISQKLLQKIASRMLETISVANYTDITIIVFSTLIYIYIKKKKLHTPRLCFDDTKEKN